MSDNKYYVNQHGRNRRRPTVREVMHSTGAVDSAHITPHKISPVDFLGNPLPEIDGWDFVLLPSGDLGLVSRGGEGAEPPHRD
jgi:hypothetical protein